MVFCPRSEAHSKKHENFPPGEYEVAAVDLKGNTLTLEANDVLCTVRVRPDTEITINGERKSFKDLEPQMRVKVTLADPGTAARLKATGMITEHVVQAAGAPVINSVGPNPPAPTSAVPAAAKEQSPLVNTKWTWESGGAVVADLQLLPGGEAIYSSHMKKGHWEWHWETMGPTRVKITTNEKKHHFLEFNPTGTAFTTAGGDGPAGHLVKSDGTHGN